MPFVASVRGRLLEPGYAYVRLSQFQADTGAQLHKRIDRLLKDNKGPLRGLVLDLRSIAGITVEGVTGNQNLFEHMNFKSPPFDNPKIRRAAFLAMNQVYGNLFDVTAAEAATPELAQERAARLSDSGLRDERERRVIIDISFFKDAAMAVRRVFAKT